MKYGGFTSLIHGKGKDLLGVVFSAVFLFVWFFRRHHFAFTQMEHI